MNRSNLLFLFLLVTAFNHLVRIIKTVLSLSGLFDISVYIYIYSVLTDTGLIFEMFFITLVQESMEIFQVIL